MANPKTLLRVSVIGTVLVALCCYPNTGGFAGNLRPGSPHRLSRLRAFARTGLFYWPDLLCRLA